METFEMYSKYLSLMKFALTFSQIAFLVMGCYLVYFLIKTK